MINYDEEINNIVDIMEQNDISKEEQIKYLKKILNNINNRKEDLERNFIVATFIYGCGLGMLCNTNDILDVYLSLGIISSGIIMSLVGPAIEKNKSLKKS